MLPSKSVRSQRAQTKVLPDNGAPETCESTNQADFEVLEKLIKEYNDIAESLTSPEKLTRDAKYNDDQIKEHVAFVAAPVLPGENFEEFNDLVAEICDDLQLQGDVEQGLGLVLASHFWRLNHLGIFNKAQRARAKYGKYFRNPSRHAWRVAQLSIIAHCRAGWNRELAIAKDEKELADGYRKALEYAMSS